MSREREDDALYELTVEQQERAIALTVARDILCVKAGRYAERAIVPADLIAVADYIRAVGPPRLDARTAWLCEDVVKRVMKSHGMTA